MDIILLLFDAPAVISFIYELIRLRKYMSIPEKTDEDKEEIRHIRTVLIALGILLAVFNVWYGSICYVASRF